MPVELQFDERTIDAMLRTGDMTVEVASMANPPVTEVAIDAYHELLITTRGLWNSFKAMRFAFHSDEAVIKTLSAKLQEVTFAITTGISQIEELIETNKWTGTEGIGATITIDRLNTLKWVRDVLAGANPLDFKEAKEHAEYVTEPAVSRPEPRPIRRFEQEKAPSKRAKKRR